MIVDRYPTPHADRYFSREAQIDHWLRITREYALKEALDRKDGDAIHLINIMRCPTPEAVATRETETGHEVVAFLQLLEEQNPRIKRHLHVGLTSSDLVEFAWCRATEQHAVEL